MQIFVFAFSLKILVSFFGLTSNFTADYIPQSDNWRLVLKRTSRAQKKKIMWRNRETHIAWASLKWDSLALEQTSHSWVKLHKGAWIGQLSQTNHDSHLWWLYCLNTMSQNMLTVSWIKKKATFFLIYFKKCLHMKYFKYCFNFDI